jgi:hypothetical protein
MRFIIIFFLTASLLFGLLYGLVIGIDPYNKLGYNLFHFETKAVDFARVNKFNQVEHSLKNYTAFIMGSSSAHRYPTKELNRLTGLVSYNYSTQSATPEDFLAMTRHILTKYRPKLFLLSFDFEALNKRIPTDDMFYASPLKNYLNEAPSHEKGTNLINNSYLTLEALGDSFKVVWVNLFGKANHAYLEDGDHIIGPLNKMVKIVQFSGSPYEINQERIHYLKTIKRLCDQNNIRIIALTSPLSLEHVQKIKQDPELNIKFVEFKNILVNIFGELWDFENESIAPYSNVQSFYNSNHPTHYFSTLILERMLGTAKGPGLLIKK